MNNLHVKPGSVKITDKSLQASLKYLAKEHQINYKNLKFKRDFSQFLSSYTPYIIFENCYCPEIKLYYLTLPKFTYHAISLKKKSLSVNSIVCNAYILAYINNVEVKNFQIMRYFILWVCRQYSHRTKNNLISSDMTVNELIDISIKYLQDLIENDTLIPHVIEQSRKNCGKIKKIIIGNVSTNKKQSIINQKFTPAEISYVENLHKQGSSYSEIIKFFENSYNKKISKTSVQRIIKKYNLRIEHAKELEKILLNL